jgi:predicted metal-binding protein
MPQRFTPYRGLKEAQEFARQSGIGVCLDFSAGMLIPKEAIRDFCRENKCGKFQNNYMCPPYVGSTEEIEIKLRKFQKGLLVQYSRDIDVKNDRPGVIQTKMEFHHKILGLEDYLKETGINQMWGMIGGNCGLCNVCKAVDKKPCPFPGQARTSMEAAAIDVISLLDSFGLDSNFHSDKITWTGCILF